MKFRLLFLFTEEAVLYGLAAVLLFLGFAAAFTMVGIIVAPFAVVAAAGLVVLARHLDHNRRTFVSRL